MSGGINTPDCSEISSWCLSISRCQPEGIGHTGISIQDEPFPPSPPPPHLCIRFSGEEWGAENVQHNGKDEVKDTEAKMCQRARKLL